MKISMREFRENLAGYLESSTPFAITRHGETLGSASKLKEIHGAA